jgi:hypothetical protein
MRNDLRTTKFIQSVVIPRQQRIVKGSSPATRNYFGTNTEPREPYQSHSYPDHRFALMRRIFVRTPCNSETSGSIFDDFGINARSLLRSTLVGKLHVFTAALP